MKLFSLLIISLVFMGCTSKEYIYKPVEVLVPVACEKPKVELKVELKDSYPEKIVGIKAWVQETKEADKVCEKGK